jgi:hypothetical protein
VLHNEVGHQAQRNLVLLDAPPWPRRLACGERAGQHLRHIGAGVGREGERPLLSGPRCASVHGFPLHAHTQVPAYRREQWERLLRYTARGAVSLERLTQDANGDLLSTCTHPWADGTTGMRLSPVERVEKLAALVPLPRVHLVRSGGYVAPHRHLRGAIIPTPRQQGVDAEETDTGSPRWSWGRLLQRGFALALARCPWCQRGALRLLAALTHGEVIRKRLQPLQRSADSPVAVDERVAPLTSASKPCLRVSLHTAPQLLSPCHGYVASVP